MCDFHTNLTDERTYTEGIGKLSTADGKAFADPEVLRRLTSSVSCALDEAAAALTRMRAENNHNAGQVDKYVLIIPHPQLLNNRTFLNFKLFFYSYSLVIFLL